MTTTSYTAEEQALFATFLLGAIKIALLRCRLDENQLLSIARALRDEWVSPECACQMLADAGLGQLLADEVSR